jgi:hypothetical protein
MQRTLTELGTQPRFADDRLFRDLRGTTLLDLHRSVVEYRHQHRVASDEQRLAW